MHRNNLPSFDPPAYSPPTSESPHHDDVLKSSSTAPSAPPAPDASHEDDAIGYQWFRPHESYNDPAPAYNSRHANTEDSFNDHWRPNQASGFSGNNVFIISNHGRGDRGGRSSRDDKDNSKRSKPMAFMLAVAAAVALAALIGSAILAGLYAIRVIAKSITNFLSNPSKKPLKSLWRLSMTLLGGTIGCINGVTLGAIIGTAIVPGAGTAAGALIGGICTAIGAIALTAVGAALGAAFGKYTAKLAIYLNSPYPDPISRTNPQKYVPNEATDKTLRGMGCDTKAMLTQLKKQKNNVNRWTAWALASERRKKEDGNEVISQIREGTAFPQCQHDENGRYVFFKLNSNNAALGWDCDNKRWVKGEIESDRRSFSPRQSGF